MSETDVQLPPKIWLATIAKLTEINLDEMFIQNKVNFVAYILNYIDIIKLSLLCNLFANKHVIAVKLLIKITDSDSTVQLPSEIWFPIQQKLLKLDLSEKIKTIIHENKVEFAFYILNFIDIKAAVLCYASLKGYIDIVRLLLGSSSAATPVDPKAYDNRALVSASCNGHYDIVKLLLENKVAAAEPAYWGLRLALVNGHTDVVRLLLENNVAADPRFESEGDYLLSEASENGNLEIVKLLLKYGISARTCYSKALGPACENGHIEVVKVLLDSGAEVSFWNGACLDRACRNGHLEIIRLLLEKGFNLTQNGCCLYFASMNGHLEIVKLLLEKGANAKANYSFALSAASDRSHLEIVKLLLKYGADPTANNNEAIHLAHLNNCTEIIKLLEESTSIQKEK